MSSPVPAKTQQLHNFSLPQLKWNKNNNNNHQHRSRRAAESPPHRHRSPMKGSEKDYHDDAEKSEKDSKAKIFIRLRKSSSKVAESGDEETDSRDQVSKKDEIQVEKEGGVENCENEEVEEPKTWNLRPRRAGKKAMNAENQGTMKVQENKSRIRTDAIGGSTSGGDKKDKKPKFSISLSREEIEDDFYVMTGAKPPRKPKKRTKTVQKQLDTVFPGLWLASVTPDCYKVSDPSRKK